MKKRLLVAFMLFAQVLSAQNKGNARLDSLAKVVNSNRFSGLHDSDKSAILGQLSSGYHQIDPNEGIKYGLQSLKFAQKAGMKGRVCGANIVIANNYLNKADYTNAFKYYMAALGIAESINDYWRMASANSNIGLVYIRMREWEKALAYLRKAAVISREHGLKDLETGNYVNIGQIYQERGEQDSALAYDYKALAIYEEKGNDEAAAMTLVNIANAYGSKKDSKRALEAYFTAFDKNRKPNNVTVWANGFGSMGEMFFLEVNDSGCHLSNGRKAARLDSARKYLDTAISFARQLNDRESMMEFREYLSRLYRLSGNYKAALENFEQYVDLRDSVFSSDNKVKIAQMETKHEADLKDKQTALNKVQEQQKETERGAYLSGLLGLAMVTGLVARNYGKQRKMNRLLAVETQKSNELLGQKEILLSEVHHRVKNNLQMITSLLQLQSSRVDSNEAVSALKESQSRVMSMAIVHQKLYQYEKLDAVDIKSFAEDIFGHVRDVFRNNRQEVSLINQLPEQYFAPDTIIPLGLILNELIINSFKYAVRERLEVKLALRQEGDFYLLAYADNGPGLPANVNLENSRTLGLHLIRRLSRQLGGYASYSNEGAPVFEIYFAAAGAEGA